MGVQYIWAHVVGVSDVRGVVLQTVWGEEGDRKSF